MINSPSAQRIINACYDLPTLNNQLCSLFTRNTAARGAISRTNPTGTSVPKYVENSLNVTPLNYAKLKVSGIDFDAFYQRHIGRVGDLSIRGIYRLSLVNSNCLDPTSDSVRLASQL